MSSAPSFGQTKLDRERQKMCLYEIVSKRCDIITKSNTNRNINYFSLQEQISSMTKALKALITKHSLKERLRTAYTYLNRLKYLCEDVSTYTLGLRL